MEIGYARVSTTHQNLDRQIAALRAAGVEKIYREKQTGKSVQGRLQLEKAIDVLGTGDVLVIAEWDRATRSMMDGIHIMQRIADRGAGVRVLDKPFLDLTTTLGKGILTFLSALAQDERERIVSRAAEGRKAAVERGVKMGRSKVLTEHQANRIRERVAEGETQAAMALEYNVSPATVSRVVRGE